MHPRFFQLTDGLPVGGAGRRLHQHKRLAAFKRTHHVVIHGGVAGQRRFLFLTVPHRIAVPGDKIDLFRQLPVVVIVKVLHKVSGHRQVGIYCFEWRHFMTAEVAHLRGVKASPVQIQAVDGDLTLRRGRFNLRPVRIGMTPEGAPPRMVECLQRLITRFQPVAEFLLTQAAVALATIFVRDMPAQHSGVLRVTLRQQAINFQRLFAIDRRGHTVVVSPTVQRRHAVTPYPKHFRIFLRHPRRTRTARGSEEYMNTRRVKFLNYRIQPGKIIFPFARFEFRPAKYPDRHHITFCLLHHGNVFFNNTGVIFPLFRVIIGAMQ